MRAWRVHRYGSPREALVLDDIPVPEPGPGQVRVAVAATVLNFNDIDGCYGRYRTVNPPIPYTAGMEVTGRVDAAGPGAEEVLLSPVMGAAEIGVLSLADPFYRPGAGVYPNQTHGLDIVRRVHCPGEHPD